MQGNPMFMEKAIALATENVTSGRGGPFGAVIVRDGEIIATGANLVTATNDPTAHGEIVAIRNACTALGRFQLTGCHIYTSCEPCPMCLGSIYWARPKRVIYANTKQDAAAINFDDDFIYNEIQTEMVDRKIPFVHHPHPKAKEVFANWKNSESKIKY